MVVKTSINQFNSFCVSNCCRRNGRNLFNVSSQTKNKVYKNKYFSKILLSYKGERSTKKLYVDTEDILSDSILYDFTEKRKEDDIEYIRKDVFVENACDWHKTHSEVDYFELIPDANYCGVGNFFYKYAVIGATSMHGSR